MHGVQRSAILVAACACAVFACKQGGKGSSEEGGGKLVPASLDIAVEIDGKPFSSITSALLRKTKPDFSEADREAWWLSTLLPTANVGSKVVETEDLHGARITIAKPEEVNQGAPVLQIDRAGEAHVVLAQERAPLPVSQRGGENADVEKVRGIRKVRLLDPALARAAGPKIAFRVIVDDEEPIDWTSANTKVKPFSVAASDGEGHRDVWPLRDLAKEIGGSEDAMVTSVIGDEGAKAQIDGAAWKDASRIPVFRTNRRGAIKFTWIGDKHQGLLDAEEVRDIIEIKIKRHASKR